MSEQIRFSGGYAMSVPDRFNESQKALFVTVLDALNKRCFENEDWNGEEAFLSLQSVDSYEDVSEVCEQVEYVCALHGAKFYWAKLDFNGTWTFRVICATTEISLQELRSVLLHHLQEHAA